MSNTLKIFIYNILLAVPSPCSAGHNCSHLCIMTSESTYECRCPSYGILVLSSDKSTCKSKYGCMPNILLLMATKRCVFRLILAYCIHCAFIIDVNGHSFSAWFSYFPTFCERILTQTTCLLYRVINHVNRQMFLCIDKKSVDFFRIRGVCGVCWQGFRTPWIATTRGRWQREWLQHPGFYCHACGCYIRSTQSASKFCVISG